MKLKNLLLLLTVATALFTGGCKDKDNPTNNNNNNNNTTKKALDLNLLHNGDTKRWYWKDADGYESAPPHNNWTSESYIQFKKNEEYLYNTTAYPGKMFWEYRFMGKDTFRDIAGNLTGTGQAEDHWLGLYVKTVNGNTTYKDYAMLRYRILELTDKRLVIQKLLVEQKNSTRLLFESTP